MPSLQFLLTALVVIISSDAASAEMLTLGAAFMAMTLIIFVFYGVFAAFARDWVLTSERAMRRLSRAFAGIFVALGARLAMERA